MKYEDENPNFLPEESSLNQRIYLWLDDDDDDGGCCVGRGQAVKMATKSGRVILAYNSEASTALSLPLGVTVEILSESNPDWWYVSCNGQMGYFPAKCLEVEENEEPLPSGWAKHTSPDNRKILRERRIFFVFV